MTSVRSTVVREDFLEEVVHGHTGTPILGMDGF